LGYREKGPPKLTLFQRRRRQGAVITLELEEHWVEEEGVRFFFTPCGRLVVPMFFFRRGALCPLESSNLPMLQTREATERRENYAAFVSRALKQGAKTKRFPKVRERREVKGGRRGI